MANTNRPTNSDNSLENELINSYINFTNTTNASMQSMLEIINNQQTSYNQILNRYNITSNRRSHRASSRYYPYLSSSPLNNTNHNYIPRNNTDTVDWFNNIINRTINQNFNEPVIVRPTQEIIELATESVLFGNIENPLNRRCPINQNDFSNNENVTRLIECNHIFNPESITRWFERHVHCPLCRNDIRNISNFNSETGETGETGETVLPDENTSFATQIANIISNELSANPDFSGNINIDLAFTDRGW